MADPRDQVLRALGRLIQDRLAEPSEVKPMSESQVHELEESLGHHLPLAYRIFLLNAGQGAGHLWQGTDFTYPELLELRSAAEGLLEQDNQLVKLDPTDTVFYMHQGYVFLVLRGLSDDPPVYLYREGTGRLIPVASEFSSWLLSEVDDEAKRWREISGH
jgi:hypothetical protein